MINEQRKRIDSIEEWDAICEQMSEFWMDFVDGDPNGDEVEIGWYDCEADKWLQVTHLVSGKAFRGQVRLEDQRCAAAYKAKNAA